MYNIYYVVKIISHFCQTIKAEQEIFLLPQTQKTTKTDITLPDNVSIISRYNHRLVMKNTNTNIPHLSTHASRSTNQSNLKTDHKNNHFIYISGHVHANSTAPLKDASTSG